MGGADRGVDPSPLVDAVAAHLPSAQVVVVEPDAERTVDALVAGGVDRASVRRAAGLAEAVEAAVAVTPAGGVVLFSPGAPTPDGGGGYRVRSRQFAEAAGLAVSDD